MSRPPRIRIRLFETATERTERVRLEMEPAERAAAGPVTVRLVVQPITVTRAELDWARAHPARAVRPDVARRHRRGPARVCGIRLAAWAVVRPIVRYSCERCGASWSDAASADDRPDLCTSCVPRLPVAGPGVPRSARRRPEPTLLPGLGEGAQDDQRALVLLRPQHIGRCAVAVGTRALSRDAALNDAPAALVRVAAMFGRAQPAVVDRDRWLRSAARYLLERAQQVPVNA